MKLTDLYLLTILFSIPHNKLPCAEDESSQNTVVQDLVRQELWREEANPWSPAQREENSKMLLQSIRALLSALIGILVATAWSLFQTVKKNGNDDWKVLFLSLTLGLEVITGILLIFEIINILANLKLNTTIETLIYLITLLFLVQIAL